MGNIIWCPSSLAKVVYSSNNLVYGRYNYLMGGDKPTNITGRAPPCMHRFFLENCMNPNQYEREIFLTNGCFHDGYMYHGHWVTGSWINELSSSIPRESMAIMVHLPQVLTMAFSHQNVSAVYGSSSKGPSKKKKTFQKDLLFLTT